ncbi:PE family protein [Mycolicibacter minnesotensis]
MPFVRTLPEAMTAAAGQLAGIGETLTAESAAVQAPTTTIAPAGTDPVSLLQAALFATYGDLYQSISAQAAAVHQQLVQTIGQNATQYSSAEQANQASASLSSGLEGFLSNILGVPDSGSSSLLSGNFANIANIGTGNWASAGSALIGLAGGGLLDFPEEVAAEAGAGLVGYDEAVVVPAGVGVAPVAPVAGIAQATTLSSLSTPPGWAAEGVAAPAAPAARLAAASVAAAQPAAGMTAVPAAMPTGGAGGRNVGRFGEPRYGVKPSVVPKAKAV